MRESVAAEKDANVYVSYSALGIKSQDESDLRYGQTN